MSLAIMFYFFLKFIEFTGHGGDPEMLLTVMEFMTENGASSNDLIVGGLVFFNGDLEQLHQMFDATQQALHEES